VVEAIPRDEDFYDFEARYEFGRTDFRCPADLTEETTRRVQQAALDTYELLGCSGFGRVDVMLEDETGAATVLEANAIPGLTETSLLPQAADAAGIDLDALVERILMLAFERAGRSPTGTRPSGAAP
jgi:D-alanine-D-alanine ligase